ncbi:MAG: helix-turn-helix transcriptional regulator [Treponema sp.]|nr:helix-turn-helix transcriptional regulator [Treponema sp.]
MAGVSANVVAKLNKGEYVSMESLAKICLTLDCNIGDICMFNKSKKI